MVLLCWVLFYKFYGERILKFGFKTREILIIKVYRLNADEKSMEIISTILTNEK